MDQQKDIGEDLKQPIRQGGTEARAGTDLKGQQRTGTRAQEHAPPADQFAEQQGKQVLQQPSGSGT